MPEKVIINEIFTSIQGEGPYVGIKQLFIRFSRCNLNCSYCDTDFRNKEKATEYNVNTLIAKMNEMDVSSCHSIVLTGGEPLLEIEFLKQFLPRLNDKKIYLETNGILYQNLEQIINYISFISMDYKLSSATGYTSKHDIHKRFLHIAKENNKDVFLKVVFDSNITDLEIKQVCELAEKYQVQICLQPVMKDSKVAEGIDINAVMDKFIKHYQNVRLIPQVHTFLGLQ